MFKFFPSNYKFGRRDPTFTSHQLWLVLAEVYVLTLVVSIYSFAILSVLNYFYLSLNCLVNVSMSFDMGEGVAIPIHRMRWRRHTLPASNCLANQLWTYLSLVGFTS